METAGGSGSKTEQETKPLRSSPVLWTNSEIGFKGIEPLGKAVVLGCLVFNHGFGTGSVR